MKQIAALQDGYQGADLALIVGCPRSGTTWLQQLLFAHPQIKSGRESSVFFYVAPQLARWRKYLEGAQEGLACYFTDEEFVEATRGYLCTLLEPMVGGLGPGELFLEKTPGHYMFLPQIVELLPQARIIYMRRDPRDVVASLLAASRTWGAGWAPNNAHAASLQWLRSIRMLEWAKKELSSEQFLEVSYEALFAGPESELARCAAFLGLAWEDEAISAAIEANRPGAKKSAVEGLPFFGEVAKRQGDREEQAPEGKTRRARPGGWQEDLSPSEKATVYLLLHDTMVRYGYDWPSPLRVMKPVDKLALGGMRVARRVRRKLLRRA